MNSIVTTSYNTSFIALSYAIAVIGSFVALTAAGRIRHANGRMSRVNLISAGLALGGIGVWSMHFIGMLALNIDMGSGYAMVETLVSLVAAVAVTSMALVFVAQNPKSLLRVAGAGTVLGFGVGFMHYLGMYGMRFGGYIAWSYETVALSLLIAVVAATAALWLAFNTRTLALRVLAAAVMGLAVCAMHYTGMDAAEFICTTANRGALPQGFGVISSFQLPTLVAIVSLGMAAVISLDQLIQRTMTPLR
jgi:NO-binding membrane sensor protein with MHYT domain